MSEADRNSPVLDRVGHLGVRLIGGIEIFEEPEVAVVARRDALRATWALQGVGVELIPFNDESITVGDGDDEQVLELLH